MQSGISTTYYYDFIDRHAKYTEKGTNYSIIEGYKVTNYKAQPHTHAESADMK